MMSSTVWAITPGMRSRGRNLQAWCFYLIAAHAIPVHRCAELIEALTGARPSPGFVHGMIARAAAAVAEANAAIRPGPAVRTATSPHRSPAGAKARPDARDCGSDYPPSDTRRQAGDAALAETMTTWMKAWLAQL
jgi:hypothetical protein